MHSNHLQAAFRHNPKGSQDLYCNSEVILLISPGQLYHEGEKFISTINLINRSQFKKCIIMIGDTNYRHTLRVNENNSEQDCYLKAKAMGDLWIERNRSIYSLLEMPFEVIRWDYWLSHSRYIYHKKIIDELYVSNERFRDAFLYSAKQFSERLHTKENSANKEKIIEHSLEYLKEECAIIIPLWVELGYKIIIYPSNMLKAMEETYVSLVLPTNQKIHWLPLRFKRKAFIHHFNEAVSHDALNLLN